MAVDFPASVPAPSVELREEYIRPAIRSEAELGYIRSRPRWTRTKRAYTLRWYGLTNEEKADMLNFLEAVAYGGGEFNWTHPLTQEQRVYVLYDPEAPVAMEYVGEDRWAVELKILER